jgi:hypothetical protein
VFADFRQHLKNKKPCIAGLFPLSGWLMLIIFFLIASSGNVWLTNGLH